MINKKLTGISMMTLAAMGFMTAGFTNRAHAESDMRLKTGITINAEAKDGDRDDDRNENRGVSMNGNIQARTGDYENDREDGKGRGGIMASMPWFAELSNGQGLVGTVTAINGSTITVKGNRDGALYAVDATGAKFYAGASASTLGALKIGDTLMIGGIITGTSVTASVVYDGNFSKGFPANAKWENLKPGIAGTVTAVNGSTITLSGKNGVTYMVNAANATFQKDRGTTMTLANISIGDTLLIQGAVSGTTVTAKNIFDLQMYVKAPEDNASNQNDFVLRGAITAIGGSDVTVTNAAGTIYVVKAGSAVLVNKGKDEKNVTTTTSALGTLKVGDTIAVQGTISGNTVTATGIYDSTAAGNTNQGMHRGFFSRIGDFFKGLFGRHDK